MKTRLTAFLLLFVACNAFAQKKKKTQDFELGLPTHKVPGSLYSTIELLDSRIDSANLGFVHIGLLNKSIAVVPQVSLPVQFQEVLNALNDTSVSKGKLLLQLRRFNFSQVPGTTVETGYFSFRANLYAVTADGYKIISHIDTTVSVKALDVTKKILNLGTATVINYITRSLRKEPIVKTAYNYYELTQMDSIQKSKMSVYNTNVYTEGVYTTYESFKDQVPDITDIQVKMYDSVTMTTVRKLDDEGDYVKIAPKKIYAVVYKGNIYAATPFGYYFMYKNKTDNDFYFTGNLVAVPTYQDVQSDFIAGGLLLGTLSELSSNSATYYVKVDPINGEFIRIEQLPDNSEFSKYPEL